MLFDEMDADNSGTVEIEEFLDYFGKEEEEVVLSMSQMHMQAPSGSPVARRKSPNKKKQGGGALSCCASPR